LPLSCARGHAAVVALSPTSLSLPRCHRLRNVSCYVCYGPYPKIGPPHRLPNPTQPNPRHMVCALASPAQGQQVIQREVIRSMCDRGTYTSNVSIHIALRVTTLNDDIKRATAKLYINASGNTTRS
jgi:hypothetical protein